MAALPRLQDAAESEARVLAFPRCPTAGRLAAAHPVSEGERIDLDRLRWLAMRSQLAPRHDPEKACYLLAAEKDVSLERFSIAFFRALSGMSREMVLYRPGAKSVSDDEIWLLRLVAAWRSNSDAAAGALVAWRVSPPARRWMRFLSAGMVRALDGAA